MEQSILNQILKEITSVKENQNTMAVQIADLAIGQNRLSEKIDNVRTELKQDIENVREEFKTELKKEISGLRTEFKTELKKEISELRAELKQDIENVREEFKTELKKEISGLREEFKTELKEEISGLRTEFKTELKKETTSIREDIRQVREIAEFTKDTCESIMRVCTHEFKKQDARYKALKLMLEDTREKYRKHEYRICKLEMTSKRKKYNIPTL